MKRKEGASKGLLSGLLVALTPALLLFASQARAGDVGVRVGINLPLPGVYVPAPVYVEPPPVVVRPAPVVVETVPVVVERRRVVYVDRPRVVEYRCDHRGHWKKHKKYKRHYHD